MAPPHCLLAVLALTVFLGANNGLPITSRPIEGNVQRMVWEDWVNLPPEQRNLTKEKKVTAKSIFTLPFRHCPQGHTLYNQLCIPQSNIDPTDLIKQELILAGGTNGSPPPPPIGDYDYGDDVESEEIVYDLSVIPSAMQDSLPPSGAAEDQSLPSEDAPLKFNIFEKKFPTGTGEPEALPLPPDMVAAAIAGNSSFTGATSASTVETLTKAMSTPAGPPGDASKSISGGDLQAAPSNSLFTSTALTVSSSDTSNRDIGQVEKTEFPADQTQDGSLPLETSFLNDSDSDSDDLSTTANGLNADAEADLAQLLKVDAFLPAYNGSVVLLPPLVSHRKVAPSLSVNQDVKTQQTDEAAETTEELEVEETTTDIGPSAEEEYTMGTTTTAGNTTVAEALMDPSPATTTSGQTSPHPPQEPDTDERKNRLVLIKSKVQPVQLAATTTATKSTTSPTEAATATAILPSTEATLADVADSSSSTDRFHYQHFVEEIDSSSSTATPEPSSSTVGNPIEQNDLTASVNDNLMTNTIGGHGDEDDDGGDKATSEIDAQQELRLINALVKGKQQQQQQQQHQMQQQLEPTSAKETQTSTSTSIKGATDATTATYINWSKVMPQLGQGTSEASTTTETAATSSPANESSSSVESAAAPAPAPANRLSITNRSNRNSKIIGEDQFSEEPAATAATAAIAAPGDPAATPPNGSSSPDGYTPFWWLPSIGWRLDRQLDGNGEDHSLLLRFFSTFRGSDTAATTR